MTIWKALDSEAFMLIFSTQETDFSSLYVCMHVCYIKHFIQIVIPSITVTRLHNPPPPPLALIRPSPSTARLAHIFAHAFNDYINEQNSRIIHCVLCIRIGFFFILFFIVPFQQMVYIIFSLFFSGFFNRWWQTHTKLYMNSCVCVCVQTDLIVPDYSIHTHTCIYTVFFRCIPWWGCCSPYSVTPPHSHEIHR